MILTISTQEKLALYADDALLFLGNTSDSISNLMSLICKFGSFSGFTINWEKQTPHIKLEILQEPKDSGGLVVPNLLYYYMTAELQHFMAWRDPSNHDPIKRILATVLLMIIWWSVWKWGNLDLNISTLLYS